MEKMVLEPTAASVMTLSQELYQDGSAGDFYRHLDLSRGEPFLKAFGNYTPLISQALVNRKWCIRHFMVHWLSRATGSFQVVNVGAGKSPLALELLEQFPERISEIFEIDMGGMPEKKELYTFIAPRLSPKVSCISADITDPEFSLTFLEKEGYSRERPSLIVMEGLAFYIPADTLKRLLGLFCTPRQENRVIVEFVPSASERSPEAESVMKRIEETITGSCGMSGFSPYSKKEITDLVEEAGGRVRGVCFQSDMERRRLGEVRHFRNPEDGWHNLVVARI
jgi:O-methyltransferase involved in polyketide biosynthesis